MIKPMRYQCRPAGKPVFHDTKFPGTYNARRDNLEGFWKDLFGLAHGIALVNAFSENVNQHRAEGRELGEGEDVKNLILEVRPRATRNMLVACLWSRWSARGEPDLLSTAAPSRSCPAADTSGGGSSVMAANDPKSLAAQHAILDDRARPCYEHRLAA